MGLNDKKIVGYHKIGGRGLFEGKNYSAIFLALESKQQHDVPRKQIDAKHQYRERKDDSPMCLEVRIWSCREIVAQEYPD